MRDTKHDVGRASFLTY